MENGRKSLLQKYFKAGFLVIYKGQMISDIPFTYSWLIKRTLQKSGVKTILELGCGKGEFADLVNNQKQYEITGLEIFDPSIDICRKKGKYKKVLKADLSKKLQFKDESFDAVICLQTIEHFKRKRGELLLGEVEKIATKLIIMTTPVGVCAQEEYDGNKYQHHLSSWVPRDFKNRNYSVFGVGLKLVYGSHSHVGERKNPLKLPLYFFSFLMNPLANAFAEIACQMVAVKFIKKPKISKVL